MAGRKPKAITKKERDFAKLIAEGYSPVESARKALGWRCDTHTREAQKARDLARSRRVLLEVEKFKSQQAKEVAAETLVKTTAKLDMDKLRQFAYDRLVEIRDDPTRPARPRWNAIQSLEKLSDPSKDINLIWRWVDIVWRGMAVHCPCCHNTFPLNDVRNKKLDEWRKENDLPGQLTMYEELDRRLFVIGEAEKRKAPHEGQLIALAAPERHIAGTGAARAGKSFLLGMFGLLFFLIPGVEIWILARIYDDARSEMEYIEGFLKTIFYPVSEHMYTKTEDKKSGEVALISKWGSELRIKSGKSQGSITGRELEACLVAEPAWVPDELYEEVRARMSSRLGRIIALGTPKGFGGFINRMLKMAGRSKSGRRIRPEERLIANGCDWGRSLLKTALTPQQNPEYVQAELEAAKEELTEEEYAAEFEGIMATAEGARFPHIRMEHCRKIKKEEIENAVFCIGVDQGEKNFGMVLAGWDGSNIYVMRDFFDKSKTTIKSNLLQTNDTIPGLVKAIAGPNAKWQYTIFDADPPIWNILSEMDDEGNGWKTELTYRPKNKPEFLNWREETMLWINEMAKQGNLWFDEECDLLHEQMMEALRPPEDQPGLQKKGWIVKDAYRSDHVADAFLMAMWLLSIKVLEIEQTWEAPEDPFEEARKAQKFRMRMDEERELKGYGITTHNESELFESILGRPRSTSKIQGWLPGWYRDES